MLIPVRAVACQRVLSGRLFFRTKSLLPRVWRTIALVGFSCGLPSYSTAYTLLPDAFVSAKVAPPSQQKSTSGFEWTLINRQVYADILKLKVSVAQQSLQSDVKNELGRGISTYLQNYADIVGLLISEDPVLYKTLPERETERLSQLATFSSASPYYLFLQAEIKLQCALVKFKFGDEFRAGWAIRQAYKLLVENKRKFPAFLPNDKSLGLLHILIGSVPSSYEWMINLAGMEGTVSQGIGELEHVAQFDSLYSLESTLLLQLVRSYVLKTELTTTNSWQRLTQAHPDNLMVCFFAASALIKEGNSEEAMTVLRRRPTDKAYVHVPFLSYLKAEVQLQKGEYDPAIESFQDFLTHFKGQNLLKDTYYKLFLCYWLNNQEAKAMALLRKVPLVGKELAEADRYAQRFYENATKKKIFPQKMLMKARLASDGGYYAQALSLMKGSSESNFASQLDRAEYNYRKARIYHKQAQIDLATPLYERAILLGAEPAAVHSYFGANAALQLGYIYGEKGEKDRALQYFERALSWPKHEYKSSIDNKAKAAINQLEER